MADAEQSLDSKVADCMMKIQVLFEMQKSVRDRWRVSNQDAVVVVVVDTVVVGSQTLPGQLQPVDCTGKQRKSAAMMMTGQGLERDRFHRRNRFLDGPRARGVLHPEALAPPVGVH